MGLELVGLAKIIVRLDELRLRGTFNRNLGSMLDESPRGFK